MPLLQRKREAKVGVRVAGGDGVEVGVLAENYLCYVGRTLALLVK